MLIIKIKYIELTLLYKHLMKILKVISIILIVFFLTVLTQVGGVVYLISRVFFKKIIGFSTNSLKLSFYKLVLFLLIYTFSTFLLVPLIAKPFGRVPLPYKEQNNLQPLFSKSKLCSN